jgi:serine/threonine protein phosphatase PrpC
MFNRWKKSSRDESDVDGSLAGTQAAVPTEPPGRYEVQASLQTDVGCHREVNEDCGRFIQPGDSELLESKGVLLIVADGMGGHSAGEVASNLAVNWISRAYYDDSREPQAALTDAVQQANRTIFETAQGDENLRGMGTTCTALVLQNGSAIAAHVGDSRLYLVRDEAIYLMTEDHSAVMEMVKRGLISLEAARHHPDKNIILRALGSQPEVEVSTWEQPFPVREGDAFLLCSDGLYDLVEDDEIRQTVLSGSPLSACEKLIALAKSRGGHDNITVGIVSLRPIGNEGKRELRETREVEVK